MAAKTSADFKKALKIKGYGSYPKDTAPSDWEGKKGGGAPDVDVKVIGSLKDYVEFINTLKTSFENPVFYRGQVNANYLLIPYSLRTDPENENLLIEAFSRRFYNEVDSCKNALSKLVLMQHYNLSTRCMDITENPLVALYFACVPYKKYKRAKADETKTWGEIILFREPSGGNNDVDKKRPERLKTVESSNVSIIANTAFMDADFTLWNLGSFWKKDANQTYNEKYINLRTIARSSFIVRVPQNNPRIRNQQGAFILASASTAYLNKNDTEIKEKELTKHILSQNHVTYADLLNDDQFKEDMVKDKTWLLRFKKVRPYDSKFDIDPSDLRRLFYTDPFDLQRLFYKEDKKRQLVVLIPPKAKKGIVEDLRRFNIREDYIYPDMDSVANEINIEINK